MRHDITYFQGHRALLAILLVIVLAVTSLGAVANAGSDEDTAFEVTAPAENPAALSCPVIPAGLEPMPLKGPITLSDSAMAKMKAMTSTTVREVPEEKAPPELKRLIMGTRGGATHHEPDHQGQYYNNNVTCAEYLDLSGGYVELNGTGTTGDQPRLWINWSQDKENSGYGGYWADYDIYCIDLTETSTSIDFVNITLTVDYGTSHGVGNERSNKDFGAQIVLLWDDYQVKREDRHQLKIRPCWWSGLGVQYNDAYLDCWRGVYGAMYNSMHFQPPYTGRYYFLLEPYNKSDMPDTTVEEVWYNLSITYTSKGTSGAFTHGQSATADIKDSLGIMTLASDLCSGKGYQDVIGNTPQRDSNQNMYSTSAWPTTLPDTKHFVNEMLDFNDWYNASGKLLGNPADKEFLNVSIQVYDSFVIILNGGAVMGTLLIWSVVYLEVWQHDPATGKWWSGQTSGTGYILFQDQNGVPIDWTHPFVKMLTNDTTDLLFVRTWTDTMFWYENDPNSKIYPGSTFIDVYDSWGYYNLTKCNVTKYTPQMQPQLSSGSVTPTEGDSSMVYYYNVTYTDMNNDPPVNVQVFIDGVYHYMAKNTTNPNVWLRDGDYTNGEEYIYVVNNFPYYADTWYTYNFASKDVNNLAATGDINTHNGPHIMNDDCPSPTPNYSDPIIIDEDQFNAGNHTCYYNMSAKFTDVETPYGLTYGVRGSTSDPWSTSFDCQVFTLQCNANNTLTMNTKPNVNTQGISGIPLYFNATDPKGKTASPSTPVYLIVRPVNDPPVLTYLYQEGHIEPVEVTSTRLNVWSNEDSLLNFSLTAYDLDGTDDLMFTIESEGSDLSSTSIVTADSTAIDEHNTICNFSFMPPKDYIRDLNANISVGDGYVKDWVVIHIRLEDTNDPPTLSPIASHIVDQYDFLNITITATDVDVIDPTAECSDRLTFTCNISDSIPGLIKGDDWDMSMTSLFTASFWFHPIDQDIIGRNADSRSYAVCFTVTDKYGISAKQNTVITIRNTNDPPENISDFSVTIVDAYPWTNITENLTVTASAPDAYDPDGDVMIYEWDFGDFRSYEVGQSVQHTYYYPGRYEIRLKYGDGEYEREVSKVVFVNEYYGGGEEEEEEEDDDIDDDVTEDSDSDKMPDFWEWEQFGSLGQKGTDDFDNDGFNNYKEYVAGTDPTDPKEHPGDDDDDVIDPGVNAGTWFLIFLCAVIILIVVVIWVSVKRGKRRRIKALDPVARRLKAVQQKVWGKDISPRPAAAPPIEAKVLAPPQPAQYQNREPEYITWHEYPEELPPPPPWYDPKKTVAEMADETGEFRAPALDMDVLESDMGYDKPLIYEAPDDAPKESEMGAPTEDAKTAEVKENNEDFI